MLAPGSSVGARTMGRVSEVPAPVDEPRDPTRPWAPSPFTRLARTHALSVAGDAAFTAAMAGTVFFNVSDLDAARGRVAMTLVFTIAPFAVAAPLIGPLIDRAKGGRKLMILVLSLLRALVAVALVFHHDTVLLYPEGLLMLVFSKGYLIARGALVPTVVRSDAQLVRANARLTLISGIASAVAILPAGLLLQVGGPGWSLGLAALLFAACTVAGFQLPRTRVAAEPPDEVERAELRGIGILLAASSVAVVRFIVGFLAFLLAFYAKEEDLAALLVVAAVFGQGGFLLGSVLGPVLRRRLVEERIIIAALAAIVGTALLTVVAVGSDGSSWRIGLAAGLLSLSVGFASNAAKQAFDAIVQRDAPDANRGRSFARFETRFQLLWVIGALIPTAVLVPLPVAFLWIASLAAFALISDIVGRRRAAAGLDHRIIRIDRARLLARARGRGGDGQDLPPPPAPPATGDDPDRTLVLAGRRPPPSGAPTADDDATLVAGAGEGGLLGISDVPIPEELATPPDDGLFAPDDEAPTLAEPRWRDDPAPGGEDRLPGEVPLPGFEGLAGEEP